ncbi:hypothetical protein F5884DRAFT_90267 [Xylogone sp. PMI_703]|nr:hypothetical protein F5884DRAFT_90267 [Xylogone sp. PMI_703]
MAYLFYSLCFLFLVLSTGTSPRKPPEEEKEHSANSKTLPVAYLTRTYWLPLLPTVHLPFNLNSSYIYSRLPSSFANDIEAGLSSAAFDLNGNVAAGDSRAGLDEASKKEIQKIMKKRRVNFDEARRIYTEERFAKNGIGADGRPKDPKFVSFS